MKCSTKESQKSLITVHDFISQKCLVTIICMSTLNYDLAGIAIVPFIESIILLRIQLASTHFLVFPNIEILENFEMLFVFVRRGPKSPGSFKLWLDLHVFLKKKNSIIVSRLDLAIVIMTEWVCKSSFFLRKILLRRFQWNIGLMTESAFLDSSSH